MERKVSRFFIRELEESDEGGYTAQCLELPAAISEEDTKEEALENIKKEAIQLVLEVSQEQARSYAEVFSKLYYLFTLLPLLWLNTSFLQLK